MLIHMGADITSDFQGGPDPITPTLSESTHAFAYME